MHDIVRAVLKRLLHGRRCKGSVHGKFCARRVSEFRNPRDVDDVEARIGRRLEPDQRGVFRQCAFEESRIPEIQYAMTRPRTIGQTAREDAGVEIAVLVQQDLRTGLERAEQRRRRGHPRCVDERGRPVLERRQTRFELVDVRVAVADVLEIRKPLVGRPVLERGRQPYRRRDGAVHSVFGDVDSPGGEFHDGSALCWRSANSSVSPYVVRAARVC